MQTRVESLVESLLNIASGFILSLLIWTFVVVPLYNLDVNMFQNLTITSIFTISAIVGSYLWRRYFNLRYLRKLG